MERKSKLESALEAKNVILTNKKKDFKENIDDNFYNHIDTLMYFHNLFDESINLYELGLPSNIWRDVETFKVWNRRGKKVLYRLDSYQFKKIIERAEMCISNIYKLPYVEMINKSMEKKEICIGKPYESNIWFNEKLNIVDISKVNFNMVENDYYKYLLRIKKRNNYNWKDITLRFIKSTYLGEESKDYIISLLSYPYESMKYIQKLYILDDFSKNNVFEKILEFANIDGESLI